MLSPRQKFIVTAVALVIAACVDGWSTFYGPRGLSGHPWRYESNPLFGRHPSEFRLFVEGGLIIAGEIWLACWLLERGRQRWIWAALMAQAVIHLVYAYCNIAIA